MLKPKWCLFYAAIALIIAAYQPVIADADRFMFLGVERDWFEMLRAESMFLFILFVYLMFPEKFITQFAFIAFAGNLTDELFFNPNEIQVVEYVLPALWIGYKTIKNHVKKRNRKSMHRSNSAMASDACNGCSSNNNESDSRKQQG